jgi:hypothetical protein
LQFCHTNSDSPDRETGQRGRQDFIDYNSQNPGTQDADTGAELKAGEKFRLA